MEQESFQPREAAARVGADTTTLSRYTRDFPAFFSETARRPVKTGRPARRYTEQDVVVLRRIKDLYAAGTVTEQVREMLHRELGVQTMEAIEPDDTTHTSSTQVVRDGPSHEVVDREWQNGQDIGAVLSTLHRAQLMHMHTINDHHRLLSEQRHLFTEQRQLIERQQTVFELYQELRARDVTIQRLQQQLQHAQQRSNELKLELQEVRSRLRLSQREADETRRGLEELPDWVWLVARWFK